MHRDDLFVAVLDQRTGELLLLLTVRRPSDMVQRLLICSMAIDGTS